MNLVFPLAVIVNTFAMTFLLIVLGISGKASLAADVGIVHGATLALFFAFSANARSLILSKSSRVQSASVMLARLTLLLPLSVVAYFLSIGAGVGSELAIVLILRRSAEWLAEVHLSEVERLEKEQEARLYLISQSLFLIGAIGWLLLDFTFPLVGLWLWAALPLLLSSRAIANSLASIGTPWAGLSASLVPHIGSSAIICITVYVFRLLVLFITGKETAGDLFTAFAIGGLTGSIFANALGASLTFHEQRNGKRCFPRKLHFALNASLICGICIFIAGVSQFPLLEITEKSFFFWRAVGLSMIGGVVMVYAQRIRFNILQGDEGHDIFGPDVLANVLLLASIPFAYYLLGREAMGALYLLSALLAYIFYLSSARGGVSEIISKAMTGRIRLGIAIALLLPIFFQASNGVFRDPSFAFNSGGKLTNLPIPFSVLACYIGIVLLGGYKRAFIAYMTIFLTCVLMIAAAILSTAGNPSYEEAKLILLMQFILPMFALALGQGYGAKDLNEMENSVYKPFLYVLIVMVPLQLIASWLQGFSYLAPSVWLFSVYQQLQYVPVIFVGAFLVALFGLWYSSAWRPTLFVLSILMSIYAAASISMLAIGFLLVGILAFGIFQWFCKKEKFIFIILLLSAILSSGYLQHHKDAMSFKFQATSSDSEIVPLNVGKRLDYWKHYLTGITANAKNMLVGQEVTPDRREYPSAHNYYLDFIFNFGILALLPILILMIYTCVMIYRRRHTIISTPGLLGLCMVVLFLLFIDNSLKVGLRQPYPGIITFFLWGVLLNFLLGLSSKRELIEAKS